MAKSYPFLPSLLFFSMYAVGPIFTVFDHMMFPSADDADAARFVVKDDKGKDVRVHLYEHK